MLSNATPVAGPRECGTRMSWSCSGRPRVPHSRGPATGVALLSNALATIECQTVNTVPAGDHTLVVGEVLSVDIADHPGEALVFYRGGFGALT